MGFGTLSSVGRSLINRVKGIGRVVEFDFKAIRHMSYRDFFKNFSSTVDYSALIKSTFASFGLEDEFVESQPAYQRWEAPNEISYLDAFGSLQVKGGVYLGVASEPANFTYITRVRPEMAILVDINPTVNGVHLPLKGALLEIATNRLEFLSYVLGRPLEGQNIPTLSNAQDYHRFFSQIPYNRGFRRAVWQRIQESLDPEIREVARNLYMNNFGLESAGGHSSEDVLLGKYLYWNMGVSDAKGKQTAWLTSQENYLYIRDLWMQGRIKGVSGDISGTVMHNLIDLISQIGQRVSCFYLSNCEDPLEIHGRLNTFKNLLSELPWARGSQIIKYDFGGGGKNCINLQKVELYQYSETAFAGVSETHTPQAFFSP
ncbi:MAG: hypothetical protein ABIH69_02175 [bacterium]|nr:hypothetical protein [Candidatus Margulisiibacteriota bacterium]